MTREHRQAQMEAFGAAVLAEDYGGVPEGWGLRQICGAGFGGPLWKKRFTNYIVSTASIPFETGVRKYETMVWPRHEDGSSTGIEVDVAYSATKQGAAKNHKRLLAKWKGKHRYPDPRYFIRYDQLGQGPWPGVDVSLQSGIQDYGSLWSQAAMDITQGKVTEADIDDAGPDAAEAIVALQNAINSLWGASGQLERTQRGRARGGRYRHRRLVQDMELLLTSFFRGATDTQGKPITWEDVVTELPATSIGPAVFNFGAKLPTYVPVEAEVGIIRLSIPSILTAGDVIELANDVSKTADDIRDLAFTWQSRGQGIPQIPSDFIMRSLSQQSSLVPSNVFTVGATRTSQCISRKSGMGYPRRQAVAMCLNMGREGRLGPRGGYRKVQR